MEKFFAEKDNKFKDPAILPSSREMARLRKMISHIKHVLIKTENVKTCNYKVELSLHTNDQRDRALKMSGRLRLENFKRVHSENTYGKGVLSMSRNFKEENP